MNSGNLQRVATEIPDSTSAEHLSAYVPGKILLRSRGEAWRNVHVLVNELPSVSDIFKMPAITEPFLACTISGEAEMQEREGRGMWLTTHVKKGSFFLTASSGSYEMKYKTLTPEPFRSMIVLLSLHLFKAALEESFPNSPQSAILRDISGFEDPVLSSLLELLRGELSVKNASGLFVDGIGRGIAAHLVRNYMSEQASTDHKSALPGFKLRRVTAWMADHLAEEFSLSRVAAEAEMSEFHFNRLFKRATGLPPSQYLIKLRIEEARRLLRETDQSIIEVGLAIGYSNPSHFAQVFKRKTGVTPTEYRQER